MSYSKIFMSALASLKSNKMRSFLTMLGIIIGVAAVIILVSLMNGMTGQITDTFADLGTNTITVAVTDRGGSRTLAVKDMYDFVDSQSQYLSGVTPKVNLSAKVKNGTDSIDTSLTGVSEAQETIGQLNVASGRFLQYIDVADRHLVCVVGTYVQRELFDNQPVLGKTVKINGYPYTIIGVLEEKEDGEQGSGDDVIYIPYTCAMQLSGTSTVSSYTVSMIDENQNDLVVSQLKTFLNKKLGDSDYYTVISMKQILDSFNTIMDSMQMVLVCIAGISLLVGGIGIMNIMLVSVTERTREIGIRKSLGAKKKYIMRQFVIEAGTVSGLGGIVGIAVGSAMAILFGKLLSLSVYPSFQAIVIAFVVSVGIGLIFGFLPANKAAKLNPIDALRYE